MIAALPHPRFPFVDSVPRSQQFNFDAMRSPRQENVDVKNFAGEIFNINVLKASLTVQALALELSTKLLSAAYAFDHRDVLTVRASEV